MCLRYTNSTAWPFEEVGGTSFRGGRFVGEKSCEDRVYACVRPETRRRAPTTPPRDARPRPSSTIVATPHSEGRRGFPSLPATTHARPRKTKQTKLNQTKYKTGRTALQLGLRCEPRAARVRARAGRRGALRRARAQLDARGHPARPPAPHRRVRWGVSWSRARRPPPAPSPPGSAVVW